MPLTLFRRASAPTPGAALGARSSELGSAEAIAARLRARDGERLRRYRDLLDFYEGKHFNAARRGRTTLVVNYARTVVDKGVSYLFGRGVHLSVPPLPPAPSPARGGGKGEGLGDTPRPPAEGARPPLHSPSQLGKGAPPPLHSPSQLGEGAGPPLHFPRQLGEGAPPPLHSPEELASRIEQLLNRLAEENELDLVLLQAATNASVLGDAVLKVYVDVAAQRVRLVNIDPLQVFPTWAGDDPTQLRAVALTGRLDAAEALERYGIEVPSSGFRVPRLSSEPATRNPELRVETVEIWTPASFRFVVGSQTVHEGPNPYGFIPFVHIPNLQPPNSPWGVSDLVDLIPLNRELNERMSDQADVIRYHADPPVVFRGVEEHSDLPVGPGTVWDLPRDADVALLEWRGSAPALQEHVERVLRALYEVTETPRTSFGDSGRLLSGVALETELQPLIQRTLRKRVGWSAALRRFNRMLLQLAERLDPELGPGAFAPYRTQVVWPPMLPRDDDAEAKRNLALVDGGLRSYRGALEALGELDPEAELLRIREDRASLTTSPESQVPGLKSQVPGPRSQPAVSQESREGKGAPP